MEKQKISVLLFSNEDQSQEFSAKLKNRRDFGTNFHRDSAKRTFLERFGSFVLKVGKFIYRLLRCSILKTLYVNFFGECEEKIIKHFLKVILTNLLYLLALGNGNGLASSLLAEIVSTQEMSHF